MERIKPSGCEFCFPPREDAKFILLDTKYWRIIFSNNQNYPGRFIIQLLRHCPRLSQITEEENSEFLLIVRACEQAWEEELGVANFNWHCMMNGGYRQKPYNPHVHWHCLPRYDHPVKLSEGEFIDKLFGHHYTIDQTWQLPYVDRLDMHARLQKKLWELLETRSDI